jgi:predicted hydrocarbon binding protein
LCESNIWAVSKMHPALDRSFRTEDDIVSAERRIDNFSMRVWLETTESILGGGGLKSILNYAHLAKYIDKFPPDNEELEIPVEDYSNFVKSLNDLFGSKGAHAIQRQAGREFIRTGMSKRPKIAKALQIASHLLPEAQRIRIALEKWAEESEKRFPSQIYDPRIELHEEEDHFLLIDRDHPESEKISSQQPACGLYVGLLEALVHWITGHHHEIEEIQCRGMGDRFDVFKISKAREE